MINVDESKYNTSNFKLKLTLLNISSLSKILT